MRLPKLSASILRFDRRQETGLMLNKVRRWNTMLSFFWAGGQTSCGTHTRQVLYHRDPSLVLFSWKLLSVSYSNAFLCLFTSLVTCLQVQSDHFKDSKYTDYRQATLNWRKKEKKPWSSFSFFRQGLAVLPKPASNSSSCRSASRVAVVTDTLHLSWAGLENFNTNMCWSALYHNNKMPETLTY